MDTKIALGGYDRLFLPVELPPSRSITGASEDWWRDHMQATGYLWGRMDMGEVRDVNDNYAFAQAYADAYDEWRKNRRVSMRALQQALWTWDLRREEFGQGWL